MWQKLLCHIEKKKSSPTVKIYMNVPEPNSWSSWGSQIQGFVSSFLCYWGRRSACVFDVMFQIGFGWTSGKSKCFWTLQFTFWGQSYWSRGQLKFRVYKRHDSVLISCLSAKERSSQWVNPANRHICNQTQRERDKEKTFFLFRDRSFKAQNAQSNPLQAKRSISLILCFIAEMKLL